MTDEKQSMSAGTKAILKAWLIAGTLDICCAMIWSYTARMLKHAPDPNPLDVLNGVGRVALGKGILSAEVLGNYALMCVIGLVVHYAIAFTWTLIFFWAWPKFKFLQGDKIVVGLCYGIVIWAVMTFAIVPLRIMTWPVFVAKNLIIGGAIIMLAVGLPISIIIGNYYSKHESKTQ